MNSKILISNNKYRVLELLKNFICSDGHLKDIGEFVNKLEQYCVAVEKIDKEASKKLYGYWWEFEQIYASYLSEEREQPNEKEKFIIGEIYSNLSKYCSLLLKKYKPEPEDPYAWPFEEYK